MHKIIKKRQLSKEVFQMVIEAPLIARSRKAGQFILLQIDTDFGERIPLTIANADDKNGTITIIFQSVGSTTHKLADKNAGDYIENVLGPLGHPTHLKELDWVVCVGGGIGVAPMYPIAKAYKEAGAKLTVIMGARNKDLLIMEEDMEDLADELIICTDDGSYGKKCLVTEPLKECCQRAPKPGEVIAIGPPIIMKFCCLTTKEFEVPTTVSLNTIMIDGTGMCGGCRVTVGDETKFVCVDGPEFDGHKVDFDNMMKRLGAYKKQETAAHDKYHKHVCRAEKQADELAKQGDK